MPSFTDIQCLVDTHIVATNPEQLQSVSDELIRVLQERLNTPDGYRRALALEDPQGLRRVVMLNAAVEVGPKYRHIHAHFTLNIMHETKFLLGEANQRMQDFFNDEFYWETASFASVKLLDSSRAKNYNAKSGRVVDGVEAAKDN